MPLPKVPRSRLVGIVDKVATTVLVAAAIGLVSAAAALVASEARNSLRAGRQ